MTAPRVDVDLGAVAHNTRVIVGRLARRRIAVCGMTKATCGDPRVARAMVDGGARWLGDSRVANAARLRGLGVPVWLTRSPSPRDASAAVRAADGAFVSALPTARALSAAALATGRPFRVIPMVDLGDLREGWPPDQLADAAAAIDALPGVHLHGIGTNMACFAGAPPTADAMGRLSELAGQVDATIGRRLAVVSGGNSANLPWAASDAPTGRVDQLRIGEAILLGRQPLTGAPIPGLRTDAFTVVADVIEARPKRSAPPGGPGRDAWGAVRQHRDEGVVDRALLAIGRQDAHVEGLTPLDPTHRVLGASSDHLVLRTATPLAVGDEVRFRPDYGALVAAMTSPYVATAVLAGVAR